jgi:hypothetical protein
MAEYIILIPDNEDAWAAADEAQRQAVYAKHTEFAQALADRGHKMTGGAELTRASEGRVVRRTEAGLSITEGPYAESAEQLSGFYLVETDDFDDLLQVCGILADGEGALEVRPCVDHSGDPS